MTARRPPHAQIHLPSLTGEQAFLLAGLLERAVSAIWRAHGDDMAEFQGRAFPDDPPPRDALGVEDTSPDELNGDDLF
jgi:hypothetical protein